MMFNMARPRLEETRCGGYKRSQIRQQGCFGHKHRIYDRVNGQFRPIGWICSVCLKITLDADPEYEDKYLISRYTEKKRLDIMKTL